MSVRYVFPILLALLATQTAQAADVLVSPSSHSPSQMTVLQVEMPHTAQPEPASAIRPVDADSGPAPGSVDSAIAEAQAQPQSQAPPSHPHHHTLRNILIITIAVGVMIIVLAAAAKK